ncbi:MAG TPA: hypothetical protein VHK89_00625 [Actinomycetota bacterium]|nr:hypothetical protein [Actinomycetota bacterium]
MLLDGALRATFRNLSTLFLLVAVVAVPLHLAHAYVFRSVIEMRELRPDIETFGPHKLIRGVGRRDFDAARRSAWGLTALELALVPLLARAARRALEVDEGGGIPTALGSLREMRRAPGVLGALRRSSREGVAIAVLALVVWWLARTVGLILSEAVPDPVSFAPVGLVEGAARALGGALLVGGWAGLAHRLALADTLPDKAGREGLSGTT